MANKQLQWCYSRPTQYSTTQYRIESLTLSTTRTKTQLQARPGSVELTVVHATDALRNANFTIFTIPSHYFMCIITIHVCINFIYLLLSLNDVYNFTHNVLHMGPIFWPDPLIYAVLGPDRTRPAGLSMKHKNHKAYNQRRRRCLWKGGGVGAAHSFNCTQYRIESYTRYQIADMWMCHANALVCIFVKYSLLAAM